MWTLWLFWESIGLKGQRQQGPMWSHENHEIPALCKAWCPCSCTAESPSRSSWDTDCNASGIRQRNNTRFSQPSLPSFKDSEHQNWSWLSMLNSCHVNWIYQKSQFSFGQVSSTESLAGWTSETCRSTWPFPRDFTYWNVHRTPQTVALNHRFPIKQTAMSPKKNIVFPCVSLHFCPKLPRFLCACQSGSMGFNGRAGHLSQVGCLRQGLAPWHSRNGEENPQETAKS